MSRIDDTLQGMNLYAKKKKPENNKSINIEKGAEVGEGAALDTPKKKTMTEIGVGKPARYSNQTGEPFEIKRTFAYTKTSVDYLEELRFLTRKTFNEIIDEALARYYKQERR